MHSLNTKLAVALGSLLLATNLFALDLKVVDKPPPEALGEDIRAKLQGKAIQLLNGTNAVYEFWFVSELPLTIKPASLAKSLDTVATATLLGAVNVPKQRRDYRDDPLPAGVHTMRLALQPQDGNHLGTAEFNWFAVLVPASLDPKPDAIKDYKSLVAASTKLTVTEHPVVMSLRPATEDGTAPKLFTPAEEHKSVRVSIPARIAGKDGKDEKTSLVFEIVYEGKGHK
jgi:hypothetical protein